MTPRPSAAALAKQCIAWNAANPIGTAVDVTRDNGAVERSKTRTEAYVMSGHSAVVMLEGISGCYLLSRCRRAS